MALNNKALKAFKAAFTLTIPVLTGFAFLGIAYGILMSEKGYGAVWSLLMSSIAFCGSMQFAAVTLLTIAFNPLQAFLLSLMVNARHLFYGICMLKKYKNIGKVKPFLIYVLCDETFSIVSSARVPENISRTWFYFWISFLDYIYWVTGSFAGGLIGSVINVNTRGLDFVLTALFTVIFMDQLKERVSRLSAFIGVGCSVVCLVLFGSGNFIIPSMAAILVVLTVLQNRVKSTGTGFMKSGDGSKDAINITGAIMEQPEGKEESGAVK